MSLLLNIPQDVFTYLLDFLPYKVLKNLRLCNKRIRDRVKKFLTHQISYLRSENQNVFKVAILSRDNEIITQVCNLGHIYLADHFLELPTAWEKFMINNMKLFAYRIRLELKMESLFPEAIFEMQTFWDSGIPMVLKLETVLEDLNDEIKMLYLDIYAQDFKSLLPYVYQKGSTDQLIPDEILYFLIENGFRLKSDFSEDQTLSLIQKNKIYLFFNTEEELIEYCVKKEYLLPLIKIINEVNSGKIIGRCFSWRKLNLIKELIKKVNLFDRLFDGCIRDANLELIKFIYEQGIRGSKNEDQIGEFGVLCSFDHAIKCGQLEIAKWLWEKGYTGTEKAIEFAIENEDIESQLWLESIWKDDTPGDLSDL